MHSFWADRGSHQNKSSKITYLAVNERYLVQQNYWKLLQFCSLKRKLLFSFSSLSVKSLKARGSLNIKTLIKSRVSQNFWYHGPVYFSFKKAGSGWPKTALVLKVVPRIWTICDWEKNCGPETDGSRTDTRPLAITLRSTGILEYTLWYSRNALDCLTVCLRKRRSHLPPN